MLLKQHFIVSFLNASEDLASAHRQFLLATLGMEFGIIVLKSARQSLEKTAAYIAQQ